MSVRPWLSRHPFDAFVVALAAGMVVFEIPTGVLADTRGRRISFLASESVFSPPVAASSSSLR